MSKREAMLKDLHAIFTSVALSVGTLLSLPVMLLCAAFLALTSAHAQQTEALKKPFIPTKLIREAVTLSPSAIETAARLQKAGWAQKVLGSATIVAAKDVPDLIVNDIKEALKTAEEYLGSYGPLRVYIVGNDVSVVEPLIEDFCEWSYHEKEDVDRCDEDQGEGIREMAYIYPGGNGFAQHSWSLDQPTQAFVLNPSANEKNEFNALSDKYERLHEKVVTAHEYFHIYQNAHLIYRSPSEPSSGYSMPRWIEESVATYFSYVLGQQNGWVNINDRLSEVVVEIPEFRSRFPGLSIADIENESGTERVYDYYGKLCVGELQYGYGLLGTALLAKKTSDKTLFFDFYQKSKTMGWLASFEKVFGLSVDKFYQELEAFLKQPLAKQMEQIKHK